MSRKPAIGEPSYEEFVEIIAGNLLKAARKVALREIKESLTESADSTYSKKFRDAAKREIMDSLVEADFLDAAEKIASAIDYQLEEWDMMDSLD